MMDISERYITMCRKANEIQQWSPLEGEDRHYSQGYSSLFYLDYPWRAGDIVLFHWDNDEHRWIVGGYGDTDRLEKNRIIWLPRQDELQDILFGEDLVNKDVGYVVFRLSQFNRWHYDKAFAYESMEQLWLGFFMWQKHKKRWNGDDWLE